MKSRITLLCFVAAGLLAGCAVQNMPLKDAGQIQAVSVAREVVVPENIYFVGKGAAFGAIGAVANASSADRFRSFVHENGIDIREIVRTSFVERLQTAGRFPIAAEASHTIGLRIELYGISSSSMLSDEYMPVLLVQAEMVDAHQEVVWKGGHYLQPLGNPVAPVSMQRMQEDPEVLRKLWEEAAEVVAARTIEKL